MTEEPGSEAGSATGSEAESEAESGETRRVTLAWKEGMRFEARSEAGAVTTVDGEGRLSASPVELLLESLGADSVEVEVTGRRRPDPPRRYTDLELVFRIGGDVPRKAAERAVGLSLETYCSVFHTLADDLAVSTEVELTSGGR